MLVPNSRFDLLFTCEDSTGVPTAPSGTPTAILVKNGTDLAAAVTVTMTGAQGVASCTIPGDAVAGDRFALRLSATVGGVTCTRSGPVDSVEGPQSLTASERTTLASVIEAGFLDDLTGSAFLAGVQAQLQSMLDSQTDIPISTIATAVASAVRANLATELARIDATVSSRLAETSYTAPSEITGAANSTTFIMPLRSTSLERVQANRVDLFVRERVPLTISIVDGRSIPVDCTGLTCTLFIDGEIQVTGLVPSASEAGSVPHRYQFTPPEEVTAIAGTRSFALRVSDSTARVLAFGHIVVAATP